MDVITHGLAGALVARAGFTQRLGRPAMIALVAGALLPDVDVVMGLVDQLSAIMALALSIGYWQRHWARSAAFLGIGGLVLYLGVAAMLRDVALARFTTALQAQGITVLRAEAYPGFPGPWVWLGVAETPSLIVRGIVDVKPSAGIRLDQFLKPETDGLPTRVSELEEVQAFLAFAHFPWMLKRQEGDDTILEYYDLRFGAAPHHDAFRLEVMLDGLGVVKRTRLNHRF